MKNKYLMRLTVFLSAAALLFAPAAGSAALAAESAEIEAAKERDAQDPPKETAKEQDTRDPSQETLNEQNEQNEQDPPQESADRQDARDPAQESSEEKDTQEPLKEAAEGQSETDPPQDTQNKSQEQTTGDEDGGTSGEELTGESGEALTEEILEEGVTYADSNADAEAALADYLHREMYGEPAQSGRKGRLKAATRKLSGLSADVYEDILGQVRRIADGERASSIIQVAVAGYLDQKVFTSEELGVDTIFHITEKETVDDDGSTHVEKIYSFSDEARAALYDKIGWNARSVMDHLLVNCPYELYWYDKTVKYQHSFTVSYVKGKEEVTIPETGRIVLYLPVSPDYAQEGDDKFAADTAKTGAAGSVVTKAQEIVAEAAGLSDWDKLCAYKEAVCTLASYDHQAAGEDAAYGDPYQLINVFDGDPDTKVVCEGYAKAFAYLCDLTEWNREISCMTLTGDLGEQENRLGHMWNVVRLWDGTAFAVDLTNGDTGDGTFRDGLFMAGAADYADGAFSLCSGQLHYRYDDEMYDVYTKESIRLSAFDAHEPHYSPDVKPVFTWDKEKRTCQASALCLLCDETYDLETTVTALKRPESGDILYTASAVLGNETYTDQMTLPLSDDVQPEPEEDEESEGNKDSGEDRKPAGDRDAGDGDQDRGREQSGSRDQKESSEKEKGAPRVGDVHAGDMRSLIGNILLGIMGILAICFFFGKNKENLKDLFTDQDGKWNPMAGLERRFSAEPAKEEEIEDIEPEEDIMEILCRRKGGQMSQVDPYKDVIREHIIFSGRVQGVGFRYQATYAAKRVGLTGWVENLPDGSVEMEVQGTPAGIGMLLTHMRSGHWIRIDHMEIEEIPVKDGERGFGVKGYY